MAGEEIAFRRASVGLPVSDVSRLLDDQRPKQAERITIATVTFDQCIGASLLGSGGSAASATWPTANRAYSIPFVVEHNVVAVKMFCFNGATASGNVDLGIYNEDAVLLVSTGSTAQAGTSVLQEFDITDTPLRRGVYYMAMVMDNTTGTVTRNGSTGALLSAAGMLMQSTAFPLPNPAVWAVATQAYAPIMGLTARSVV